MRVKYTLSHRTPLPTSVIATLLILNFIADLQLAHKGTTYWPKYTIKCVGVSIRLPYATETVNLAKPLGNKGSGCLCVLYNSGLYTGGGGIQGGLIKPPFCSDIELKKVFPQLTWGNQITVL